MAVSFSGRDIVVHFKEDPGNAAVTQYRVEYHCTTSTVVHYIKTLDTQGEDEDGNSLYRDVLTYGENEAAGLTRNPTVTFYAQDANLVWSEGLAIPLVNPVPVLPHAPEISSSLDGVTVTVSEPSDRDFEGFVVWVSSTPSFALNSTTERYRGRATQIPIPLPYEGTFYMRVAPYDAFGLDTYSAWSEQEIARISSAEQVMLQLDLNADTLLEQTFRVDDMEAVFDARTFVAGQPVSTVLLEEKTQRETDVAAILTTLDLIGAKSPSGTAWILNAETVQTEPGTTLAATLEEISVKTSDHEASIINLSEVLIGTDGVTAKSVLQINVDGHVSGIVNTNDGTVSDFSIVTDNFRIVDPNNGLPFVPFSVSDDVIRMSNVEVDTIKVGSGGTVGIPSTVSATTPVSGTGTSTYHTILTQNVTLVRAGHIFAHTSIAQGFPDGDETWNTRLRINGVNVFAAGGQKTADSVSMSGSTDLPAGTYAVEVQFAAHSSVSANGRTLFVLPTYS